MKLYFPSAGSFNGQVLMVVYSMFMNRETKYTPGIFVYCKALSTSLIKTCFLKLLWMFAKDSGLIQWCLTLIKYLEIKV